MCQSISSSDASLEVEMTLRISMKFPSVYHHFFAGNSGSSFQNLWGSMSGWFHCSAVHSVSLRICQFAELHFPSTCSTVPQFFSRTWLLGTVRTGHLRHHSRCRACTDPLCMSDEVWLHRLGWGSWRCDDVTCLTSMSQVFCRTSLWEACASVVPWHYWGLIGRGKGSSHNLNLAGLAACTWPRLGFCTHDCIQLWGHFNWCL